MVEIIKYIKNIPILTNIQEFKQRFVSTIVLCLLFVSLFLLGNPVVTIFFSILFSFVFFEYEKLNTKILQNIHVFKILLLQIILLLFSIFEIYRIEIDSFKFHNFVTFLFIAFFFNNVVLLYQKKYFINFILSNLIIFSFFSLIGVLQSPNGLYVTLYVVILVSTMDIFAYLGGKLFGKRKIVPSISKGKTIEGTIFGLFTTIIFSYLIKDLMNFNFLYSLIYGFLIGVLAFLGDLLESIFKRKIGVKDSGNLIPGHGGLLDRLDGYFLVIPFLYISIN